MKQGTKIRTSKVILQGDGSSADITEFAIVETGGAISGVSITAAVGIIGPEIYITVTDAATTNVSVKYSKVSL